MLKTVSADVYRSTPRICERVKNSKMENYPRIKVLKASGECEPFSEEKVRSSLKRAGAEKELIEKIIKHLRGELYEGISTRQIYSHVFALLKKFESHLASKYNLKQAIMELGPSGYPFEKFMAGILVYEGYQIEVGQIVQGKCVSHEIDVIAQKDPSIGSGRGKHFMVECKFHNRPGTKSDIQVALYTYARFLDVEKAWVEIAGHKEKFHQAWLVTNTKVTSEVKTYARCVGLKVISWDYPPDFSLRFLIEKSRLYPVTCLNSLNQSEKRKLLENGIVFCRDLIEEKIDFLPPTIAEKVRKEAIKVCQNEKV